MEDSEIVKLYFRRDESALNESLKKYKVYLMKIAQSITDSPQDAEECVNDALLSAWESIPPHRPELLSAYLGKLTRNLAINRRKMLLAEKRGRGEAALVLDELAEVIGTESVEQDFGRRELSREINAFLEKLPETRRNVFISRYWYCESVGEIAEKYGMKQNAVSAALHRTREKLRVFLRKRGYSV